MQQKHFFWIMFAVALYGVFALYRAFWGDIAIALLLCVATFGLKNALQRRVKINFLSSFLALAIFVSLFALPLWLTLNAALGEISRLDVGSLSAFFNETKAKILSLAANLPPHLQEKLQDFLQTLDLSAILKSVANLTSSLGKGALGAFSDLVFILIFLYLFYFYGRVLLDYALDLVPFSRAQSLEICGEISGVLRVVFFSTIISMALQGLSFGVLAAVFGFSGVLFGTLFALCSIVPVVGGALVWLPVSLYLYWSGDVRGAVVVAAYAVIFIGTIIDNLIKPLIIGLVNRLLLKKPIAINEMLIFVAIIAGVSSFGVVGIIAGPAISAFFLVLLRLYRERFKGESGGD